MAHRDTRPWQRYRIEDQTTQLLPSGNLPFRLYLSVHHLTSLDAARLSGVRYATTWKIEQNKPIRPEYAAWVRSALYGATGVAYRGPIAVHADERPLREQAGSHGRRSHGTL